MNVKKRFLRLRIKIRTLVNESRLIRDAKNQVEDLKMKDRLHGHRVDVVRRELRLSLLALGFLRGRTYEQIEGTSYRGLTDSEWKRVQAMVYAFADPCHYEDPVARVLHLTSFQEWRDEAKQRQCDNLLARQTRANERKKAFENRAE